MAACGLSPVVGSDMAKQIHTTLDELGRDLAVVPGDWLPEIGKQTVHVAIEEVHEDMVRSSPVGSLRTMNHRGTSEHPGKYRSSHKVSSGRKRFARLPDRAHNPVPGVTDVIQGLSSFQIGETVFVTNDAASDGADRGYADVLEAGGSPQAPDGIYGPATERLSRRSESVVRKGIRRAQKMRT